VSLGEPDYSLNMTVNAESPEEAEADLSNALEFFVDSMA
jgi:predicted RNase H-like HicB family nuclease